MWGVRNTLALIEDLRRTPCLWDVQCKDYKNREKKDEAYEALSKKYGVKEAEAEKKVQALKNQFRREHKKVKEIERSGSSKKKIRWFGYDELSFLIPRESLPRGSVSKGKGSSDDTDGTEDDEDTFNTDAVVDSEYEEDGAGVTMTFDPSSKSLEEKLKEFQSPLPKRKKLQFDTDSSALNSEMVLTENVSKRDQYTVYGEHIANKLRLSGRSRFEIAIAQHKIDEICFKLTLGALARQ